MPVGTYGLHSNPAVDVAPIRHVYDGRVDFYSPDEVWSLVRAAAIEAGSGALLLDSGVRRVCGAASSVALRVRDVDFEQRVLRVER